jgi:hypothetical protein
MTTAQPFKPFWVKLADGRQLEVRHPENIAMSPNGRDVTVYDDDGTHLLEALLILELTPIARPASARRKAGPK